MVAQQVAGKAVRDSLFLASFDVTRRPPRILSFSVGRHLCLGIHVARLEARVAIEEILSRFPDYQVDFEAAQTIRTEFIRGYTTLPIQLRA